MPFRSEVFSKNQKDEEIRFQTVIKYFQSPFDMVFYSIDRDTQFFGYTLIGHPLIAAEGKHATAFIGQRVYCLFDLFLQFFLQQCAQGIGRGWLMQQFILR